MFLLAKGLNFIACEYMYLSHCKCIPTLVNKYSTDLPN